MSRCCSTACLAIDAHFDARVARQELDSYRKNGPGVTTTMLRDGLTELGLLTGTLLDVGAGIGALTFELLGRGVERAVSVDASQAFVAAGRQESVLRNQAGLIDWVHGDFVALADTLAAAELVTLDRVVCCYPDYEPLLARAASHARRALALSYPRDVWYVRMVMAVENLVRAVRGSEFRVVVHPAREMEQLVFRHGFALARRSATWVWCADVYTAGSKESGPARKGSHDELRRGGRTMSKPGLGAVLGAVLGLLDGLSAFFYPEVASMMMQIVIGSTIKGLVTGLLAGWFARKLQSLPLGIVFGLGVGLFLSYLVAAMPDPKGNHYYFEIMLPGAILGAIVGFATQRYGAAKERTT
jgi:SAM-dependent methyltransferase